MPRPEIEPHLRRRLIEEQTVVGSLFQLEAGKEFFCSLYAPGDSISVILADGSIYATGTGDTADDAVWAARSKLWGDL